MNKVAYYKDCIYKEAGISRMINDAKRFYKGEYLNKAKDALQRASANAQSATNLYNTAVETGIGKKALGKKMRMATKHNERVQAIYDGVKRKTRLYKATPLAVAGIGGAMVNNKISNKISDLKYQQSSNQMFNSTPSYSNYAQYEPQGYGH